MNWTQPVFVRNERFSVPELLELVDNISSFEDYLSGLPPVRAKGGEVYIYKNEQNPGQLQVYIASSTQCIIYIEHSNVYIQM